MLVTRSTQQGFSLIELMIAVAAASFLMLGLITLHIANSKHSSSTLNNAKLDITLSTASSLIEQDVVNAGYWGGAGSNTSNPFMYSSTAQVYVSPTGDCVLLSYDKNGDGSLPAISSAYDDERYGYRIRNNAIQYRPWGASYNCAAAISDWENLTDPNVVLVQGLTFTPQYYAEDIDGGGAGTSEIQIGWFTLNMVGADANNTSNTKTIIRTVRMRNDLYIP